MASPLKSLFSDGSRYLKALEIFLGCSTETKSMEDFFDKLLPDILARIVDGKSNLNVIGVGCGTGEHDLKMLSVLHLKYPEMTVDNEAMEPTPQQLNEYKDLVSQTPGLDHIKFHWSEMTAEEFEEQWKEKKRTKKADFIHMLQMLYFVKDHGATISFYQSLLNKNGKLLITLLSGNSGWGKLWQAYTDQDCNIKINCMTTDGIKRYLDSKGLSYQSYELPNQIDITDCFTVGNEKGELMLDFLTQVAHFSRSVSTEIKAEVMELLRRPDCSMKSDGKVLCNHNFEVIVVDPLT